LIEHDDIRRLEAFAPLHLNPQLIFPGHSVTVQHDQSPGLDEATNNMRWRYVLHRKQAKRASRPAPNRFGQGPATAIHVSAIGEQPQLRGLSQKIAQFFAKWREIHHDAAVETPIMQSGASVSVRGGRRGQ
jgi:hypothetical protein